MPVRPCQSERDKSDRPGYVDAHIRLGGAAGTGLQVTDCPPRGATAKPECIIGSTMMHVTDSASAYLENVWLWTADHDLE